MQDLKRKFQAKGDRQCFRKRCGDNENGRSRAHPNCVAGGRMELMDAIRNRRAVREFADVALSRSTIQALIEAANLAPSAMNLQPWAFAVLSDRKRIDDCSERIKGWLQENWPKMGIGDAAQHLLDQPGFTVLYQAPALVVVLAEGRTDHQVDTLLPDEPGGGVPAPAGELAVLRHDGGGPSDGHAGRPRLHQRLTHPFRVLPCVPPAARGREPGHR